MRDKKRLKGPSRGGSQTCGRGFEGKSQITKLRDDREASRKNIGIFWNQEASDKASFGQKFTLIWALILLSYMESEGGGCRDKLDNIGPKR